MVLEFLRQNDLNYKRQTTVNLTPKQKDRYKLLVSRPLY